VRNFRIEFLKGCFMHYTVQIRFLAFIVILFCSIGGEVKAETVATLSGGQINRAEYIGEPTIFSGTYDFIVESISGEIESTAYLNVVVDLNIDEEISESEWIVQNIPVNLSTGLVSAPLISVWFDPPEYIYEDLAYESWVTIEDHELDDWLGYLDWHYSPRMCPEVFVWGSEDPEGQTKETIPASQATTAGVESFGPRKDVPDIPQKTNECGPTSAANSLRWLAKKYNFNNTLPASDDDLIKALMKAMTGSDTRPFGGLSGNQLYDGKKKYIKDNTLPLVIRGGNTDVGAKGGKAFDFIKSELKKGEDVEFLIWWPGGGGHWVTVVGYAVKGNRLFLSVHDPDDKKTGIAVWELDKNGNFKSPKGSAGWAVSESYPCPTKSIYGEYSETTELLRYFRDNVLIQTSVGQEITQLYYEWSPLIARAMEEDKEFKKDMKEIIDGILPMIRELVE